MRAPGEIGARVRVCLIEELFALLEGFEQGDEAAVDDVGLVGDGGPGRRVGIPGVLVLRVLEDFDGAVEVL